MARVKVPITPAVLSWAIEESSLSRAELAERLKATPAVLASWESGADQPTLTQFKRLTTTLKRQGATFLLPAPPDRENQPTVKFRHLPGDFRLEMNSTERSYVREASRVQRTVSWILQQMNQRIQEIPRIQMAGNQIEGVARDTRRRLLIQVREQKEWVSASEAFQSWRSVLERRGILVFLFSMGRNSCRGFSLWDERAPVIAINTWWNPEARIFSLFHEYGHLLTRTASVCAQGGTQEMSKVTDPAERWCEKYAAATLLPASEFLQTVQSKTSPPVRDLEIVRAISRTFKTSLKATVLRLVDQKLASWELFNEIPANSDLKPATGGGSGRTRSQIKEDQYGARTKEIFLAAIGQDLMERSEVLTYLDIPNTDFPSLRTSELSEHGER